MIDQVIIQSTADTSQAENEYVGLRKEIKLLKSELDLLEEGTAEYDATFTKLSNKMKQQQDRTKALRSSSADLGDLLGNTSKVIGGVSQAFAAATASLSLFGIENEQLLKTIQKVQAFESIARTFTGLEETITKTLPALKNNITAFFKDTNKLKLNVGVDTNVTGGATQQAVQTIDTKSFKEAAESSERMAQAQQGAAGAMSGNVGTSNALLATERQLLQTKLDELKIEQIAAKEKFKAAFISREEAIKELTTQKQITNEILIRLAKGEKVPSSSSYAEESKKLDDINTKLAEKNKALEDSVIEGNKVNDAVEKTEKAQQNLNKTTTGFGKIWGQMKGILTGVGVAAAITIAITLITKLVEWYVKLNKEIKAGYDLRIKANEELAAAITKSTEKELSTLKALNAGYKNLGDNKEAQNKYLKDNAKFYKEIGIDITKIVKGEKNYQTEIEKTTKKLIERGKAMGVVNLLIEKYGKQAELATQRELNVEVALDIIPKKTTINGKEVDQLLGVSDAVRKRFAELIATGYGSVSSISTQLRKEFGDLTEEQLKGIRNIATAIFASLPENIQTNFKDVNVQLNEVNKTIAKLEPQVTGLFDNTTKETAGATTVVKSYNELIQETLNLYQGLNLNNPFTPEKIRQIELQFENVKSIADKTIFEIANNESLSDEEKLRRISDVNQTIIAAERVKILALRQISLDNAKWERNNQLRQLKEQAAIQKNNYKQAIEDAKASLKNGSISQTQFDEIFNKVQVAAGTSFKSVKEFYDYLGGNEVVNRNDKFINGVTDVANTFKKIDDGVETFDSEGFKKKIKDLYNVDLDVENPLGVDLGKLSVDEFNFLQQLIKLYQDYNNTVQGIQIQANTDTKANTEKNYAEQLDLLNELYKNLELEFENEQSKLRTKLNDDSNITFLDLITGKKSGYNNIQTKIDIIKSQLEQELTNYKKIQDEIEIVKNRLKEPNITIEQRDADNKRLKELDVERTQSEEAQSKYRGEIFELEQQRRQKIYDATVQGLEDVSTTISNIYDANETTQLNNLKRLLNARAITQEQYEIQSEALANEYAKKRQRIEIFNGLLSATASSISAFATVMRPDSGIPYPYNLIVGTASAAAAFSAVIAQVATLRGLSIGDTSSTPVQSTAGTGLNYTLQEQQVTNERLLNSLTNQRIYVLEADITSAQSRVSEVQAMSVF